MYETAAWAKTSKESEFKKINIQRNLPGPKDVTFDVLYCGICHTDLHFANDELGLTSYPVVPGHELAGVVTSVGTDVTSIKVGDNVGMGAIVDCCGSCIQCTEGEENYCTKGFTLAFNYPIVHGGLKSHTGYTLGGYCQTRPL